MKLFKNNENWQFLLFFLALFITIAFSGCSNSAQGQLHGSLSAMEELSTYKFEGVSNIAMGNVQGSGKITFLGYYQAPSKIYMKMDMGILDQTQNMELYINDKGKVFTKIAGQQWVPYMAPPNLSNFQQPGQNQNGVQIIRNLEAVLQESSDAGTEELDGKETLKIKATADSEKLKTLIFEQLTQDSRSSEEEKDVLKQMIDKMDITQSYTINIEPESQLITKLNLKQQTDLNLTDEENSIITDMVVDYSDFNKPVKMPEFDAN